MRRRILSLWLPRLAAERTLRRMGGAAEPFAVVAEEANALRLVSVDGAAAAIGLAPGMALTDARAIHPGLLTRLFDPQAEAAFRAGLLRWALRWSPWAGAEPGPPGEGAMALDITGCAHLFGGEAAMAAWMIEDLAGFGLTARAAIADTRGAAWALARFARAIPAAGRSGDAIDAEAHATRIRTPKRGKTLRPALNPLRRKGWERGRAPPAPEPEAAEGAPVIAPSGSVQALLAPLPVAALRLEEKTVAALTRLGLRAVGDLVEIPRAALARRFGADLVRRLDQATGAAPEPVSPVRQAPVFAVRLTLPDPIGLRADIALALDRLLARLCEKLETAQMGARRLRLTIRRADHTSQSEEIGLARPSRTAERIAPLFAAALDRLEAGFGVDAVRLEAVQAEPLAPQQHKGHFDARAEAAARVSAGGGEAFAELMGRIGARIGLERLTRFQPADSHIPEKTFHLSAAAFSEPAQDWTPPPGPRPVLMFPPEPISAAEDGKPPHAFRWRRQTCRAAFVRGPERIAPEWWLDDPGWRSGPRDYWRVETETGARLWLYEAKGGQTPGGWFAQGAFA
jgi:protein ImuB